MSGAINLQLAWRRNIMSGLSLSNHRPTIGVTALPLVDGGVIEGNRNVTGGDIAVPDLNATVNVLLR